MRRITVAGLVVVVFVAVIAITPASGSGSPPHAASKAGPTVSPAIPWSPPATSGDSAIANRDGRLEVFRRTGSSVDHAWQLSPGGPWSGWASLLRYPCDFGPGEQPRVVINRDGRLEVFLHVGIGGDSPSCTTALLHTWQITPGGAWSGWTTVTSPELGDMTVFANADGRLEIFGASAAAPRTMVHLWQTMPGGAWTPQVDTGGRLLTPVESVRQPDGRVAVIGMNDDRLLSAAVQVAPNAPWTPWFDLPSASTMQSGPWLGLDGAGRVMLAATSWEGNLLVGLQPTPNGSCAGLPVCLDVSTTPANDMFASAMATNADGRIEIFGDGPGPDLASAHTRDPRAVTSSDCECGADFPAHLWQTGANVTDWSEVAPFGPGFVRTVTRNADGRLEAFDLGERLHRWQLAPNGDWSPWVPMP